MTTHPTPDGLVIDTTPMGRRAGSMMTLRWTVPAPDGWSVTATEVPASSPIELDIRLEGVVEGVLVTGSARVTQAAECSRCLDPARREVVVPVQQLFEYPDLVLYEERTGDEEPLPTLDGELLDLEPVLRDAVVLELPLAPVCSPNCPGLCPQCGARLADEPDHEHRDNDPRWGALAAWSPEQTEPGPRADRAPKPETKGN